MLQETRAFSRPFEDRYFSQFREEKSGKNGGTRGSGGFCSSFRALYRPSPTPFLFFPFLLLDERIWRMAPLRNAELLGSFVFRVDIHTVARIELHGSIIMLRIILSLSQLLVISTLKTFINILCSLDMIFSRTLLVTGSPVFPETYSNFLYT